MHIGTCPQASDVFKLYCALEAGQSVRDLCIMYDPRARNVDERCSHKIIFLLGFLPLT